MGKKHSHKKTFKSFNNLSGLMNPAAGPRHPSKQKGHNRRKKGYERIPDGQAPYRFARRKGGKSPLSRTHERLLEGHYDIALEIEWTAHTPLALNPCIDYGEESNCPDRGNSTDYSGYNRRWLMIDDRPAISPFTVKSAIASAFANLMGGCYRVNTIFESHKDIQKGQYPYVGAYKRYRVAMDGSSRPGIIREIRVDDDGARFVRIQPVKEYYMDNNLPDGISPGDEVTLKVVEHRRHRPPIVKVSSGGNIRAKYHAPYHYGMNLSDPRGFKHKHRFYVEDGKEVTGIISRENFLSMNKLKELVYLGGCDQNNRPIPLWYEDLTTLKEGDFVYFETFNGSVCHIGKNFLFKALFHHEDTIPPDNETCKSVDKLCPRCSMFGMTAENEDASGFRGRFLASTLNAGVSLRREKVQTKVPLTGDRHTTVEVVALKDDGGNELGRQFLLPILGPPKPNKRDVNGYFDKQTGYLKGAKVYRHTKMGRDEFQALIRKTDNAKINMGKTSTDYSHNLRNWAEVLYEGISFSGTVGAENCRVDEIAALLMILHTTLAGHGFKIGLGKAVGLGSVTSRVKKIWLRSSSDYRWRAYDTGENLESGLDSPELSDMKEALLRLKKADSITKNLNMLDDAAGQLNYPAPGLKYWEEFNKMP